MCKAEHDILRIPRDGFNYLKTAWEVPQPNFGNIQDAKKKQNSASDGTGLNHFDPSLRAQRTTHGSASDALKRTFQSLN